MEIDEVMFSRLIAKAVREIGEERAAAAEKTRMVANVKDSECIDAFSVKDSPLVKNCKPCSQNYWAQRRKNS